MVGIYERKIFSKDSINLCMDNMPTLSFGKNIT